MAKDSQGFTTESGSAIKPQYAQRSMKCYAVTESELKQIGLANIGVTAFFGIGSALIAFGLDLFKDLQLAETVPDNVGNILGPVQILLFIFGAAFWVVAVVLYFWRRGMIKLIKEASD